MKLFYVVVHDITDRKRMEEQLKKSLKEKEVLPTIAALLDEKAAAVDVLLKEV